MLIRDSTHPIINSQSASLTLTEPSLGTKPFSLDAFAMLSAPLELQPAILQHA